MTTIDLDLSRYKLGWSDGAEYVFRPEKGLNIDVVDQMSWWKGEPEWMRQFRLRSLRTFERKPMADHELFFARVTHYGYGRLKEPPLVYSSRHGWRRAADKARPPGVSIRDQLLARVAAAGFEAPTGDDEDDDA